MTSLCREKGLTLKLSEEISESLSAFFNFRENILQPKGQKCHQCQPQVFHQVKDACKEPRNQPILNY